MVLKHRATLFFPLFSLWLKKHGIFFHRSNQSFAKASIPHPPWEFFSLAFFVIKLFQNCMVFGT